MENERKSKEHKVVLTIKACPTFKKPAGKSCPIATVLDAGKPTWPNSSLAIFLLSRINPDPQRPLFAPRSEATAMCNKSADTFPFGVRQFFCRLCLRFFARQAAIGIAYLAVEKMDFVSVERGNRKNALKTKKAGSSFST